MPFPSLPSTFFPLHLMGIEVFSQINIKTRLTPIPTILSLPFQEKFGKAWWLWKKSKA
jgi:hypothetical protein